jgi:hypothetical protein
VHTIRKQYYQCSMPPIYLPIPWANNALTSAEESLGYRLHPLSWSTAVTPNLFAYPCSHSRLLRHAS